MDTFMILVAAVAKMAPLWGPALILTAAYAVWEVRQEKS